MKSFKYILLAALAAFCCLVFIKVHWGIKKTEVPIIPQMQNMISALPGTGVMSAQPVQVYGYLILRGDSSTASMKENLKYVNGVIVEALHMANGQVTIDNQSKQKPVFNYIRANNKEAKIIALINNYSAGKWQVTKASETLADATQRAKVIEQIEKYILDNKLDGVSLDFEGLRDQGQQDYVTFCGELYKALKKDKLSLSVNLEVDPAINYSAFAKNVDQFILMNYDEHSVNTDPGPIASSLWFKQNLKQALNGVDPGKVVAGLGAYAYDWEVGGSPTGLTYESAAQNASVNNAEITLDKQTQNSNYQYSKNGKQHVVWLLDRLSALIEKTAAQQYGINTFAVYRFGSEDQSLWKALK